MQIVDECLEHYRKLLNYLEEDLDSIKEVFQDELMDAYRAVVKKEILEVNEEKKALKKASGEF